MPTNKYPELTESWELDFYWAVLRQKISRRFRRRKEPALVDILFLIGIQETGFLRQDISRKDKEDLIQVGAMAALEALGYYKRLGTTHDGWPLYQKVRRMPKVDILEQSQLIKRAIVEYFRDWIIEGGS